MNNRLQALAQRLENRFRHWSRSPMSLGMSFAKSSEAAQPFEANRERLGLASSLDLSEASDNAGASSQQEPSQMGDAPAPDAKETTLAAARLSGPQLDAIQESHNAESLPKEAAQVDLAALSEAEVSQTSDASQSSSARTATPFAEACHNPAILGERTRHRIQSATLFALAVVGFTGLIGQRLYNQPALDVGKVASKTLYAPRDATVIDEKLTQERRREATLAAIPVLRVDLEQNLAQRNGLIRTFRHGSELRSRLGPFPAVNPSLLSSDVQRYLRQLPDSEWNRIRQEAKAAIPRLGRAAPLGQKAISQLHSVAKSRGGSEFLTLEQQLTAMRQQYLQATALLRDDDLAELNAAYSVELFELSDQSWEQLKASVSVALERVLAQGIAPGLAPASVDRVIALHLELAIPQDDFLVAERLKSVAAPILRRVLKPNLIQDAVATQRQAEQAASNVSPSMVSIRQDDAIVEVGQQITSEQLVLLDAFQLSQRGPNWIGLLFLGGIVWVEVSCLWLLQRRLGPRFRRRDWLVVGMVAATTPLLFALRLPMSSLPAVGLLVGSFYGSPMGVAVVGLLAIALPMGLELEMQALIASAASGIVGALVSGRLRSREELALLGLGVGLTQCIVHLLISLILSGATGLLWLIFLRNALSHALRGIAWSVVALGVSPYLERLFDLITPIRMAELSNPNRPLLQRLAKETPGTFQHTLFVSTLAEAAARALGCNVELIRAGTLYHDIGKMHDPQGFIENQMGGTNKHDVLDDPWKSAAIIKKHVTEGQVMARRCSLPRALQNFIPEHQGTMRISYFYQQAQKRVAEEPERYSLNEADFRYDGPIPQSRETGIVMLADSCEAALRSLKDATSEEALNMVKKIIRARWKDNQLCDSGLSKTDLDAIAAVFVQIWQQFHHKRIPYPTNPSRPPALSPS